MHIPDAIYHSKRYQTLAEYWPEKEALALYHSGVPFNQVDRIKTIIVPPGPNRCGIQGLGGEPMIPVSWDDWEAPLTRSGAKLPDSQWTPSQAYGIYQTLAIQPDQVVTAAQVPSQGEPDQALAWVEDNWMLLAAGMGGLLLVSLMTKKGR